MLTMLIAVMPQSLTRWENQGREINFAAQPGDNL
jgi:hypothetical protein